MEDGRRVKFLFLPDGEDPDTLIRQIGEEKFTRLIELAVPLEDFLFDAVADGLDTQNMEGRARLSKLAAPLLDKLPKGVFRELMFANLANRTGLGKDTLMELIKELPKAQNVLSPVETNKPRPAPRAQRTKKEGEQAPSRAQTTQPAEQNAPPEYHYEEMPVDEGYAPNYEQEGLGHYDAAPYSDAADQPATQSDARSRYLMPPNLKIIALTLSQPSLAAELEDYQFWEAQNDPALQLFARLVKILQQRPHYNMAQIIGFWSASYGEEETRYLTEIAGNDLVQTTKILAKAEEDEQAGYDLATAFTDTLASLHRKIKQVESAKSLDKLKNSDLTQLSKEEKRQLVADALQGKDTNGP